MQLTGLSSPSRPSVSVPPDLPPQVSDDCRLDGFYDDLGPLS